MFLTSGIKRNGSILPEPLTQSSPIAIRGCFCEDGQGHDPPKRSLSVIMVQFANETQNNVAVTMYLLSWYSNIRSFRKGDTATFHMMAGDLFFLLQNQSLHFKIVLLNIAR